MEQKKYRAAIFDMDGVIVDSEIVYNDYLLAFAQTKNPAVTMDQINPMVGRTKKDSWMIMADAIGNGRSSEDGTGRTANQGNGKSQLSVVYANPS